MYANSSLSIVFERLSLRHDAGKLATGDDLGIAYIWNVADGAGLHL